MSKPRDREDLIADNKALADDAFRQRAALDALADAVVAHFDEPGTGIMSDRLAVSLKRAHNTLGRGR